MGGWLFEDRGKKCCRIGCNQPLSGLNRVTARGFNRAPAAWMRMQKKKENNGSDNCKTKAKPRPSV